jgi:hypothetical protein
MLRPAHPMNGGISQTLGDGPAQIVTRDTQGWIQEGSTGVRVDANTSPSVSPSQPPGTPKRPEKPRWIAALRTIFSKRNDADPAKVIANRRRFVMAAVLGTLSVNFLMFLRFFLPRVLYEPNTRFKIGYPSDFGFGVDTKFQSTHRI